MPGGLGQPQGLAIAGALLLAGHQGLVQQVYEDARPDAGLGDRERRVAAASHERPDLVGVLEVGAIGLADRREPDPGLLDVLLFLTLGMRAEDEAVPGQQQAAADPGNAHRDPLRERRVVAHSLRGHRPCSGLP